MSLDSLCRACSVEAAEYELINLFAGSGNLAKIFYQCTSLEITSGDGLPNHLCADCNAKLIGFNKFRVYCAEWDAYFRENLPSEIKKEYDAAAATSDTTADQMSMEVEEVDEYVAVVDEEVEEADDMPLDESQKQVTVEDTQLSDGDDQIIQEDPHDSHLEEDPEIFEEFAVDDDKDSVKNEVKYVKEMPAKPERKKNYICQDCAEDFPSLGSLQLHRKREHNPDERELFICDVAHCNKEYLRLQTLRKHMRLAHGESQQEKSFVCEHCGKVFKNTSAIKKHTSIHTGILPYACTRCPKKYVTKHKLKEHMMRHEGIKNHICPVCGLRKTTPHELKIHMNYHTREKMWPCPQCPQVFSSVGNMQRHVKIVHCGIKDFPCSTCGRSFGKAETLKHHVMTHTGERPHECEVCNKRFIQVVALQTHMKTHNKAARNLNANTKQE